jgi:hypothetical protein
MATRIPHGLRATSLALAVGLATFGTATALADPRIDYMLHCEGCHLPEAVGWPGLVPSLRGDYGRIAGVPGGRDYLMRVPGAADAPMPSSALAAVLNWLMDTYNADTRPAGFEPFTAAEVEAVRRKPLDNPQARRTEIFAPPRQ